MPFITAMGTANPRHRVPQARIADFMVKVMSLTPPDERKLRSVFRRSGIEYRYSVLEDYGADAGFSFFPENQDLEPFPSTHNRMEVYKDEALALSLEAIGKTLDSHTDPSSITHLITVSCTGMYAPGLDIEIIHALKLPTTTSRLCVNFMGCYAAINAIRTAHAFCKTDAKAKVLVVCTELCSLHFQKFFSEDNLLANALFGDGSAALLVESSPSRLPALELINFHNDVMMNGNKEMAWGIGDFGFEMRLSSYVPDLIKHGIRKLTDQLLLRSGLALDHIRYFAIHPGGKKILAAVEEALGLSASQNHHAYEVLRQFGNMSSASVLFVLQEIFRRVVKDDHDRPVMSFAFGPGLTFESMILNIRTT